MDKWSKRGALKTQTDKLIGKVGRVPFGQENKDATHTLLVQELKTLLSNGRSLLNDVRQQSAPLPSPSYLLPLSQPRPDATCCHCHRLTLSLPLHSSCACLSVAQSMPWTWSLDRPA